MCAAQIKMRETTFTGSFLAPLSIIFGIHSLSEYGAIIGLRYLLVTFPEPNFTAGDKRSNSEYCVPRFRRAGYDVRQIFAALQWAKIPISNGPQ